MRKKWKGEAILWGRKRGVGPVYRPNTFMEGEYRTVMFNFGKNVPLETWAPCSIRFILAVEPQHSCYPILEGKRQVGVFTLKRGE